MNRSPGNVKQVDIARLAGVSVATVSLALSGRRPVAEKTKITILRLVQELGYSPDHMARGLRLGKTWNLALMVGNLRNPFYADLASSAGGEAARHGYHVALYDARNEELGGSQVAWLDQIKSRVDGFLITTVSLDDQGLGRLDTLGKPVVLVNRTVQEPRLDSVSADNEGGMAELTHHLIQLGHQRIGYVAGPSHSSASRDRLSGFRKVMARAGLPLNGDLVVAGDLTIESGVMAGRQLIETGVTAIIAGNDLMAYGVLDAARSCDLNVPKDLSVAGYDDIQFSALTAINLTTVRANWQSVASHATRLLLDRISGAEPRNARRVLIPASLVVRGTTAPVGPGLGGTQGGAC